MFNLQDTHQSTLHPTGWIRTGWSQITCALLFGTTVAASGLAQTGVRNSRSERPPSDTGIAADMPNTANVTAIPFTYATGQSSMLPPGYILFPAEVDGLHGSFLLDIGATDLVFNKRYVQPNGKGGIDTAAAASHPCPAPMRNACPVTVHTIRVGTVLLHPDTIALGGPGAPEVPPPANAAILHRFVQIAQFAEPVLGFFGVPAMEPFETIIDYTHQRLILIRLDAAGNRLAAVPAYTPAFTVPLVATNDHEHWGVEGRLGATVDTLLLDTGAPMNTLAAHTQQQWTSHMTDGSSGFFPAWILDSLQLGGHSFLQIPFLKVQGDGAHNVLGYPFLSHSGVVGFNFRKRQLVIYR